MAFEKSKFIVDVVKHEHANMDSLPFRYGIHFEKTVQLDLFNCKNFVWQNKDIKFEVEANFVGNNGKIEKGLFIIMYTDFPNPKVVTVWRNEIQTEHHLSTLLTGLRKEGKLTPYDFLKLHPKYLSGEANTFFKLSQEIHKLSDISLTNNEIKKIIDDADKKAKIDFEEIQRLKEIAKEALELVDIAEQTIKFKEDEIKRLEDENVRLTDEIKIGQSKGSKVIVEKPLSLVSVETDVMHRGSMNTILNLEDGTKRYIKVSTFDNDGKITKKAQSLIGKKVKITAWDPINDPGKWSKQGYFRNIYEVQ